MVKGAKLVPNRSAMNVINFPEAVGQPTDVTVDLLHLPSGPRNAYQTLTEWCDKGSAADRPVLISLAVSLLAKAGPLAEKPNDASPAPAKGRVPWLERVLHEIDTRYGERLSVEELAEISGMSLFYFVRRFNQETGLSPGRYLRLRRIERAIDLIAENKLSLADIAYRVGFSSQSHMTSGFKRYTGFTPGYVRRTFRQLKAANQNAPSATDMLLTQLCDNIRHSLMREDAAQA